MTQSNFTAYPYNHHKTVDKGHGRVEVRQAWTLSGPSVIPLLRGAENWAGLATVVKIQSERYLGTSFSSLENRYFIATIPSDTSLTLHASRTHWHVENSLHWVLDLSFREDDSRIRADHAPHNFAILRHFARNLLSRDSSSSTGTYNKRLLAGWDDSFLESLLAHHFT